MEENDQKKIRDDGASGGRRESMEGVWSQTRKLVEEENAVREKKKNCAVLHSARPLKTS